MNNEKEHAIQREYHREYMDSDGKQRLPDRPRNIN